MIMVTGAAGFIGSVVASHFMKTEGSASGESVIAVDDFSKSYKSANWKDKGYYAQIERDDLKNWLKNSEVKPEAVIHLGARTDTAEMDVEVLSRLNVEYSQMLWNFCTDHQIPLVYASSAATYGGGEHGFRDNHDGIPVLEPLNPYGRSKQEFDLWVLEQEQQPPFWAGLKFFNVYGPNEYHKGRMASVIWHAYNQVSKTGGMKLFRSHNPEYADGEQQRDFIFVMDVVKVIDWMLKDRPSPGIYNLGTGKARTFYDLTRGVFRAMGLPEQISFIDTPEDIRDNYQYFTEADMSKLKKEGYVEPFTSLEDGIEIYVQQFLQDLVIY